MLSGRKSLKISKMPVHDAVAMTVGDRLQNLVHVLRGGLLTVHPLGKNLRQQLAPSTVVRHNVEVRVVLKRLVNL